MHASRGRLLLATIVGLTVSSIAQAGGKIGVVQIPYDQWLAAQGNGLVAFQGRANSTPNSPLTDLAVCDYNGVRAEQQGLSFGFTGSGSITEKKLSDGTGEVLVNIDFTNAITWASDSDGVAIFGYTPGALHNDPSLSPGLSSGHLQAKYTVPDADFPELNLVNVVFNGAGTVTGLSVNYSGTGPLRSGFGVPEGTPGEINCVQVGHFLITGGANADAFPVEHVFVRQVGGALRSSGASSQSPTNPAPAKPDSWGEIKARYLDSKGHE